MLVTLLRHIMRPSFFLSLCLLLCLLFTSVYATTNASVTKPNMAGKYVINLMSNKGSIETSNLKNLEPFQQYHLYLTEVSYKNSKWSRLRLGFFESRDEALLTLEKVRKAYPKAWITTVTEKERTASAKQTVTLAGAPILQNSLVLNQEELSAPPSETKPPEEQIVERAPQESEKKQLSTPRSDTKKSVIEQARDAMTARDYDRVVQLTTYLLNEPGKEDKQEALELLGLARERKKQYAHAKAEYEKYLSLYPKGESADRVRQRLAGLITAYQPVQVAQQEKTSKREAAKAPEWRHIGSLSQFYYRNQLSTEEESNRVDGSLLISTIDTTSRLRSDDYNHRVQLTADNQYSFIDGESNSRFSNLYYEIVDRKVRNSFRIGRQSYDSGGVLGRFDGLIGGIELDKVVTLSASGGSLLENDEILDLERHRKFASANINIGTIANKWDFNVYAINQLVDNITDRKAYGTEIRYFEPTFNIFSLMDYDVYFNELNTFIFTSNWVFPDTSSLFANIDIRKSPYLSTSNALIGQTDQSINELLNTYTEDEIKQLAQDRTAQVNTYTVGGTLALTNFLKQYGEYRLSMDLTLTNTSSTPASGGVEATEATGDQYFLNTQLIGNSIISRGDTSILFLRNGFSQDADDYTIGINSRFQVFKTWRLNPIIQYNNRSNKRTDSTRTVTRIIARVENRFQRNILFETELGIDYESDDASGVEQKSDILFFHLGYRIDF